MKEYQEKFQRLLRELFQFDCADLDFGIYRIMNYKRDVIEKFITQDLPKAIAEELDRGALADQSQAAKELGEVVQQIRGTLGRDTFDADGNLVKYQDSDIGKKYEDLKAKAAGGRGREALEAGIFNHLYAFFSRYYQDGDFISKRRYSKRQRYAIPYNGEEVYLYWANNDQYYVKTAEHFHDYTFMSRGVTVHFKLQVADVEQNNVKGDKRFFLPRAKEITWDEKANQIVIPFEYRPLTEQEEITYGKKNQQEAINTKALEELPKQLGKNVNALRALTAERRKTDKGEAVSYLEHHLRQYTRRNTSDFFIHKDLKGFLSRELDFYLKNEVLNLDEMETAGEDRAEGWFQMMRVIKSVGSRIIDFLDQIENFQKMLWEKRKFITETQYCVTIGNVDESFYPKVAACEPQWDEWKELFHIDEEETNLFNSGKNKKGKRIAFLKGHPTLVIDTKHFDAGFVDKLLASVDDLDGKTDGLLIHSENFQALNLMLARYREQVKCVYIDPPYNTGFDGFLYKDQYQHSTWLTALRDRMMVSRNLMANYSGLFISIGNEECANLRTLLEGAWGSECFRSAIIQRRGIKSVQAQFDTIDALNQGYDYVMMFARDAEARFKKLMVPKANGEDEENSVPIGSWNNHWRGTDRPSMRYPLLGVTPTTGQWRWGRDRSERAIENYQRMLSELRTNNPSQEQIDEWVRHKDETSERLDLLRLSASGKPEHYVRPSTDKLASDLWTDLKPNGSHQLQALFGAKVFENPKSADLVRRLCQFVCDDQDIVLDFYAGSGTTGHGVINWNRYNGGVCSFILVEMDKYFDTVLLPRIKKITFTPEWKDGKPKRMATQEETERSPRIIKYMRVESYEDALNNIAFDDSSGQQALGFEDYLLKYMIKWETRGSETLLNVEKLAQPFSYKLHIHADGQTNEKIADVPETFNYLLGLHVQKRQVHDDDGRRYLLYRGRIDHRQVAVIWRETEGWQKADLERDKKFVAERKLTEGADEVFVNGDSFIPNARALEPVFKARMFAEVQV